MLIIMNIVLVLPTHPLLIH